MNWLTVSKRLLDNATELVEVADSFKGYPDQRVAYLAAQRVLMSLADALMAGEQDAVELPGVAPWRGKDETTQG